MGKGTVGFDSYLSNTDRITFDLVDVLYVPDLAANLLSVVAAVEKGVRVTFTTSGCTLAHQGKKFARGDRPESLGIFKLNIAPKIQEAYLMKTERSLEDWHRSLGH